MTTIRDVSRHPANERGYTLLESVVAMAIFVGVMIPLIAAVGNFMLDGSASLMRSALHEAETEMTGAVEGRAFTDARRTTEQGFIVERRVRRDGYLIEVNVLVASAKRPEKLIVRLHKTVLDYE
jgi:prepilin-type N-terminal cleavage/methylation domain-containing protein